jgi:hypothetical protein
MERKNKLLPGEVCMKPCTHGNLSREGELDMQKSAEAIVLEYGTPETGRAEHRRRMDHWEFDSLCRNRQLQFFFRGLPRGGSGESHQVL